MPPTDPLWRNICVAARNDLYQAVSQPASGGRGRDAPWLLFLPGSAAALLGVVGVGILELVASFWRDGFRLGNTIGALDAVGDPIVIAL